MVTKNVIINGDSIEQMNNMPENSVDMIFADPPYWMRVDGVLNRVEGTEFDGCDDEWDQFESLDDYEQFTENWLRACHRILKPNGTIWVIGGMQCIYTIGAIMQRLGFWLINDVVWHKKNPTPNFKGTRLNNSHETLIWAAKSKKSKYKFNYKTAKELNTDTVDAAEFADGVRKQMGSVWRFSVCSGTERIKDDDGNKLHSTQKPLEMLQRIVAISSNVGDVVLDPFGGTMTTGVAAKMYGRNYIMIERDKKYCDYGARRLAQTKVEMNDVANAVFDVKPVRVKMPDMIAKGYFVAGEDFCFRDGVAVAKLMADGNLMYQGQVVDMHSCAAQARGIKASRVNGFDYWYVKRGDKYVSIAAVREQYRNELDVD